MTLGSSEKAWIESTFDSYRKKKSSYDDIDVVSIDAMSWLVSRPEGITWRELNEQFYIYLQGAIETYTSAHHFYISFDYLERNDAKLLTQQKRDVLDTKKSNDSHQISEYDLWHPKLDQPFSLRLYRSNLRWRCHVLYNWLNAALDQFIIQDTTTMIISGLWCKSLPVSLNYLEITLTSTGIKRNHIQDICHRYKEGDQRQLFYLLRHPQSRSSVVNRDGDLFTASLLFLERHPDHLKALFWDSENWIYDMIQCRHHLQTILNKTLDSEFHNQPSIFITKLLYLRGNDYVVVPLAYTNMKVIWEVALKYHHDSTGWIYKKDLLSFNRLASLIYSHTKNNIIMKPAQPIHDYLALWFLPMKKKRPPPTEKYFNLIDRLPSFVKKPILFPGESSNAVITCETGKGMLHPRLLAITEAQITFAIEYNTISSHLDSILNPFETTPSGESLYGFTLVQNKAIVASIIQQNPYQAIF